MRDNVSCLAFARLQFSRRELAFMRPPITSASDPKASDPRRHNATRLLSPLPEVDLRHERHAGVSDCLSGAACDPGRLVALFSFSDALLHALMPQSRIRLATRGSWSPCL